MPSSWVLTKQKGAPVAAWRASGTHRRTVESLDFAPVRSTRMLACSRSGAERADGKPLEERPGFQLLSQRVTQSEPANTPALLTSHHSSTLELGLPRTRQEPCCGIERRPSPKAVSEWEGDSHGWHLHRWRVRRWPPSLTLTQPQPTPQCTVRGRPGPCSLTQHPGGGGRS